MSEFFRVTYGGTEETTCLNLAGASHREGSVGLRLNSPLLLYSRGLLDSVGIVSPGVAGFSELLVSWHCWSRGIAGLAALLVSHSC
jgi:hypothetical protein